MIGLNVQSNESDFFVQNMKFVFKLSEKALRDIVIDYETIDEEDEIINDEILIQRKIETIIQKKIIYQQKEHITINQGNKTGAVYVK